MICIFLVRLLIDDLSTASDGIWVRLFSCNGKPTRAHVTSGCIYSDCAPFHTYDFGSVRWVVQYFNVFKALLAKEGPEESTSVSKGLDRGIFLTDASNLKTC